MRLERIEDERGGIGEICHLGGEHSAKLARLAVNDTHGQTHPIPLACQEVAKLVVDVDPERRLVESRRDHGRVGVGHCWGNGSGNGFYESRFAGDVRPRKQAVAQAMWLDKIRYSSVRVRDCPSPDQGDHCTAPASKLQPFSSSLHHPRIPMAPYLETVKVSPFGDSAVVSD